MPVPVRQYSHRKGLLHLARLALLLGPGAACFPPVFFSLPCSSGTGTEAPAFPIILAAHSACSHIEAVHTAGRMTEP